MGRRGAGLLLGLLLIVLAAGAAGASAATVAGVVRTAEGAPLAGVELDVTVQFPFRTIATATTGLDGSYALTVPTGSWQLSGSLPAGSDPVPGLPERWSFSGPLTVGGDRTLDLKLPAVATLTVRVLDGEHGDAPLADAGVALPSFDATGGFDLGAGSGYNLNGSSPTGATDAAGEVHALEFDGTSPHLGRPVTVTPPASSGYAPLTSPLPDVNGDTSVDVRAPVPFYWVTGVVRDGAGAPLADVAVSDSLDSVATVADGAYRIKAKPAGNNLTLAMPGAAAVALPPNWVLTGRFSALADRTLDVTLPQALNVTTRILGDEDEPVPGTQLLIPRFSYFFPLETYGELTNVQLRVDALTRTTDASGEAQYVEFDGTQPTNGVAARATPPADSGYDILLYAPSFNRFDLLDVEHVHDTQAPAIAFAQSPDGANGWWSGRPASVRVTASDGRIDTLACTVDGVAPRRLGVVSGPGSLSADLTVRGEGRHAIACTATDRSGNRTSESTAALIDLTNPLAPALAADRSPDYAGGGGWWADAVTVTATDSGDPLLADGSAGSGVDPGSVPAPQTFATSGRHVASASVSDVAGNASRVARLAVRVDADAPATTLGCPATVRLGARANATWDDDDAESGLVGDRHGRVALDTTTPGSHTVDHTATDRVGHTTTSSCSYEVV